MESRANNSSNLKSKLKKYLALVILVIVLILSFSFYWRYYSTYSDGSRAGLLQKFSYKGNLFKTYEGEMVMNNGIAPVGSQPEKFFFSVTNEAVAKELDQLQGKLITVKYEQKNNTLFWRGESVYIVVGVQK